MTANVLILAVLYVLINLPFGYLRAGVSRKSEKWKWLLYVHLPIPFVVCLRLLVFKVSWQYLPFLVGCYALGQWGGGRLRKISQRA